MNSQVTVCRQTGSMAEPVATVADPSCLSLTLTQKVSIFPYLVPSTSTNGHIRSLLGLFKSSRRPEGVNLTPLNPILFAFLNVSSSSSAGGEFLFATF
jgi:hypothetical protein